MLGLSAHYVHLQEKLEWFQKFNHYKQLEDRKIICRSSLVLTMHVEVCNLSKSILNLSRCRTCWSQYWTYLGVELVKVDIELVKLDVGIHCLQQTMPTAGWSKYNFICDPTNLFMEVTTLSPTTNGYWKCQWGLTKFSFNDYYPCVGWSRMA